ncbi:hypothetical protein [Acaryochloris sp. CCMEE 5410]|uniref:hypothetical protein n=1 Tax=Acaryochloris sp. CCMEE 5410 TaxID=310037 RepID=UPI0021D09A8C|nr:hypothetical protein [Acaryochloris sp. CCMEE 5410]
MNDSSTYVFTLPKGLLDDQGTLHRQGGLRLATGHDEIKSQRDPRVQDNPHYGALVLLTQAITFLGRFQTVTPLHLEQLFLTDFLYLQEVYVDLTHSYGGPIELGEHWATP